MKMFENPLTTPSFLSLSDADRLSLVDKLRARRDAILVASNQKRVVGRKRPSVSRNKRRISFLSPELEKIFYSFSEKVSSTNDKK